MVIFLKKWDKFKVIAGLRVENTNVKGTQLTTNQINKRNYTQLFPSAVVAYDLNENSNLEINLSRRITRPSYNQLNPFKLYLDPTTMRAGNPDLNPQTTMNYELTYSLNKHFATLSYSKTSDNITDIIKPIVEGGENVTVQTFENLNSASYFWIKPDRSCKDYKMVGYEQQCQFLLWLLHGKCFRNPDQ
jgi:outer membrane receptor protein involved in Fe transport